MPKLPPKVKPVTVVGIRRLPNGTTLTFSDGKKLIVQRVTMLGWDSKLKDSPTFLVNGQQFKNEVPTVQRKAWYKAEIAYLKKKEEKDEEV